MKGPGQGEKGPKMGLDHGRHPVSAVIAPLLPNIECVDGERCHARVLNEQAVGVSTGNEGMQTILPVVPPHELQRGDGRVISQ
jgi:hypothetical protein